MEDRLSVMGDSKFSYTGTSPDELSSGANPGANPDRVNTPTVGMQNAMLKDEYWSIVTHALSYLCRPHNKWFAWPLVLQ